MTNKLTTKKEKSPDGAKNDFKDDCTIYVMDFEIITKNKQYVIVSFDDFENILNGNEVEEVVKLSSSSYFLKKHLLLTNLSELINENNKNLVNEIIEKLSILECIYITY